MAGPRVDFVRADIAKMLPAWEMIDDFVAGEEAVKAKKTKYLPKPTEDTDEEAIDKRYTSYLHRAVYYNFPGRTLKGLVGLITAKAPTIEFPAELDLLKVDIDGAGTSVEQQAKALLNEVTSLGRAGLLVDYPAIAEPQSKADIASKKIKPTVTLYKPECLINYRTEVFDGLTKLVLVVIEENFTASDDGFKEECKPQWRALRLVNNVYQVELYQKEENAETHLKEFKLVDEFTPVDASGKPFDFIPFQYVGSENNSPEPDEPPLRDIVNITRGHFQNSADYEETCYMMGQPTPFVTGISAGYADEAYKDGKIRWGVRAVIPLPEGATAGLIQAQPNTIAFEAMGDKKQTLRELGAKLITTDKTTETATGERFNNASETSVLSTIAANASAAYQNVFTWAARFAGATGEVKFVINSDFALSNLSTDELTALVGLWQSGAITDEEMRTVLTKAGVATEDLVKWKANSENQNLAALTKPVAKIPAKAK